MKDDCKRRAGGLLSPYDTETFLLKLSEVSPSTMTLLRKLTDTEAHVNTYDIHRVDAGLCIHYYIHKVYGFTSV